MKNTRKKHEMAVFETFQSDIVPLKAKNLIDRRLNFLSLRSSRSFAIIAQTPFTTPDPFGNLKSQFDFRVE